MHSAKNPHLPAWSDRNNPIFYLEFYLKFFFKRDNYEGRLVHVDKVWLTNKLYVGFKGKITGETCVKVIIVQVFRGEKI